MADTVTNVDLAATAGGGGGGGGGGGDVVGPASSTDNAIARFNLATGKLLQNSVVLVGDTGAVTGVESISIAALGLKLRDTNNTHNLTVNAGSNLTADRTFTLTTGDAARTLTMAGDATISGTNTGDQTITLTSDVTGSGTGSFAVTIANDAVTNAKLANVATATFKGRTSGGAGDPEDMTAAQAFSLLETLVLARQAFWGGI